MSQSEAHPMSNQHPLLASRTLSSLDSLGKVVSARDAVRLIDSGDTVATDGFVGNGFAEGLALALEGRFQETGEPRDLMPLDKVPARIADSTTSPRRG